MKFFRWFKRSKKSRNSSSVNTTPSAPVASSSANPSFHGDDFKNLDLTKSKNKTSAIEATKPPAMLEQVPAIGLSPAPILTQEPKEKKSGIFTNKKQKQKLSSRQKVPVLERKVLELKREKRAQAQQWEEERQHLRQKLRRAKWQALKQEQAALERLDKCARAEVVDVTLLEQKFLQEKNLRKSMADSALKLARQKEGLLEQRHEHVEKIRKLTEQNRKLRRMILDLGLVPEEATSTDSESSRRPSFTSAPASVPDTPPLGPIAAVSAALSDISLRYSAPPLSLTPLLDVITPPANAPSPLSMLESSLDLAQFQPTSPDVDLDIIMDATLTSPDHISVVSFETTSRTPVLEPAAIHQKHALDEQGNLFVQHDVALGNTSSVQGASN